MVTLSHFEMPYHLVQQYGWRDRKLIDFFITLRRFVSQRYQHKVKYWMTCLMKSLTKRITKMVVQLVEVILVYYLKPGEDIARCTKRLIMNW